MTLRHALAAASVSALAGAVLIALAAGTSPHRVWLGISGLLGVALTFPSLVTDPRDLLPALVFCVPPVIALAGDPGTTWLIGPLAVLLLVGAELGAASWEAEGKRASRGAGVQRTRRIGQLAALSLVGAVAVTFAARLVWLESTVAVVVAAGALAGLAGVTFTPAKR